MLVIIEKKNGKSFPSIWVGKKSLMSYDPIKTILTRFLKLKTELMLKLEKFSKSVSNINS